MGHLALRTESGARAWANVQDAGDLAAMTTEECCGRAVSVNADSLATFA